MKNRLILSFLMLSAFRIAMASDSFVPQTGDEMMSSAGFATKVSVKQGDWRYSLPGNHIFVPSDTKGDSLSLALYLHEKSHAYLLSNEGNLPAPLIKSVMFCAEKKMQGRYGDGVQEALPDIMAAVVGGENVRLSLSEYRETSEGMARRPLATRIFKKAMSILSHFDSSGLNTHELVGQVLMKSCSDLSSSRHDDFDALSERSLMAFRDFLPNVESALFVEMSNGYPPPSVSFVYGEKVPFAFSLAHSACKLSELPIEKMMGKNACRLSNAEFVDAACSVLAYHVSRDASKEESGDYAMRIAPKTSDGRSIGAAAIRNSVSLVLMNDLREIGLAVDSVCTTNVEYRQEVRRNLDPLEWAYEVDDYGGFYHSQPEN